jgi:hypothetical protein
MILHEAGQREGAFSRTWANSPLKDLLPDARRA